MEEKTAEDFFREEAKRLGISIREYCRRNGIVYSTMIGKEVGYGEPTVPLSSVDQRRIDEETIED